MLLEKDAGVNAKNQNGQAPLDLVTGKWNDELAGAYREVARILQTELDLEQIKNARPKIAALLAGKGSKSGKSQVKSTGYRGSYFVNGEIHVNIYGMPEGKPLTTGHQDFKPSWSKTGDMLAFFRRLKDDPVATIFLGGAAMHIINVDGTGLHPLSDGTHTDFNQTWTRDGTNTPIWNRKHPQKVSFQVMASKVGNEPGQEVSLTDKRYHTWAYTCLIDGRILVQCAQHPHTELVIVQRAIARFARSQPDSCSGSKRGASSSEYLRPLRSEFFISGFRARLFFRPDSLSCDSSASPGSSGGETFVTDAFLRRPARSRRLFCWRR